MWKPSFDIKKLLSPSDSIAFLVVILGLIIAIFIQDIAIRLIGISITVLGIVALVMLISQRYQENIGSGKSKLSAPPPNFSITVKQSKGAKHQVIEDFDGSFGNTEGKSAEHDVKNDVPLDEEDEGFRVVGKMNSSTSHEKKQDTQPDDEHSDINDEEDDLSFEYTDDFSGVKILGKTKIEGEEQKFKTIIEQREQKKEKIHNKKPSDENLFSGIDDESLPESEIADDENKYADKQQVREAKTTAETPKQEQTQYKQKVFDSTANPLMDNFSFGEKEPRKEFEYFLNRVLMIIRTVASTKTAAFLLVNTETMELVLETYITDIPGAVSKIKKFPLGNDVVSQIVLNMKPEILTEINPSAELDLIPYYGQSVSTSSFIGVPVIYNNTVVGVLCADTDISDAYDSATVGILGHFTKLIGSLIVSYTEKYDLIQSSRTLDAVNLFRRIMSNQQMTLDDIYESIVEAAGKLFEFSSLGVCSYDEKVGGWVIKALRSKEENAQQLHNSEVKLEGSLIGKAILSCDTVFKVPNLTGITRLNDIENPIEKGFFAAVPLKSFTNNYGSLFIEGRSTSAMTDQDLKILETLGEHAGSSVEQMLFIEMLQSSLLIDNTTGLLNPPAFYHRLDEEYIRHSEAELPLSVCVFQIDKYQAFNSSDYDDRSERILYHTMNIVRKHLRPYDVFGRIDGKNFGIILIGMKLQQAQLWAERLRSEIAISVLEIQSKRFTVTISAGVAQADINETVDQLIENVRIALDLSLEKTNSVNVYD